MIHFYISPKYFELARLQNDEVSNELNSKFCSEYFLNGPMAWCLQSYINLKSVGYPCTIVNQIPDEGIVLGAYRDMPFLFKPKKKLFFVSIREDGYYSPYANLNISQNPEQCAEVRNSVFVPFWPQYGLVPRNNTRENQFDSAAFFGYEINLVDDLQSSKWNDFLSSQGINWRIVGSSSSDHEKLDYSYVDIIIAVRAFNDKQSYLHKPANKLVNAWLAGVPAILGRESAFRATRRSEYDYIETNTYEEVEQAVKKLKQDEKFRSRMIENGFVRAREYSVQTITNTWIELLEKTIMPAYNKWLSASAFVRNQYLIESYFQLKKKGLQHRLHLKD